MVRTAWVLVFAVVWASGCSGTPPKAAATAATAPEAPPAARAPAGLVPPQPTLRLPRNFVPTSYAARLDIDPARDDFAGSISIAGVVDQASSVIWLHGRNLAVGRASATSGSAEIALTVTPRGEDLLELRAATPLAPGAWTLMLDYTGQLELVNTAGAFKQTVAGASYVYTQLEALYARRVFPCVDEPDVKVPWKLTLDVPSKLVAVGNAPTLRELPLAGDKKRVELAVTRPLPSYLVAFGVGPFEIVDAGASKRGTPVRIVTLAGRQGETAYARQTAATLLDLAEEWFGTPYPYEKLDLLTIPLTVGFGAMENAGLITFTETLMLLDEQASHLRRYRWIVVAAHELAHQWFGNLVTMAYWDDLWLNEGFASWLQRKISARFEPAWHDEDSGVATRNGALVADSLASARRVRQPITAQDDILNAFDRITYSKGASVLAMFEGYLGAEVFQRGVRAYLRARAWGNATSADFASAISEAAGADLRGAFASFLDQPGAPEITATLDCNGAPRVQLQQQRYLPPGAPVAATTRPWIVPVCVAYDRDGARAEACALLDQPTGALPLDARACPRWVMPNAHGRGYYRNAYAPAQLEALRREAWPHLTWPERRAIAFDVREGARTGRVPLPLAMTFVPALLAGADRFTVPEALELVVGLERFVPPDLRGNYERWLRYTFGARARQVGWIPRANDRFDVEGTRSALLAAVAWSGRDPSLIRAAVRLAADPARWRQLPQAIRGLALRVAVDARADVFDRVIRDVRTEPDRGRRQEMFAALASVRDVARQARALALVIDPALDLRETLTLLHAPTTDATLAAAQRFFRAHEAAILARLPADGTQGSIAGLSSLFASTCQAAARAEVASYVTRTFAARPGGARVVAQHLEELDQCIASRPLLEQAIRTWMIRF